MSNSSELWAAFARTFSMLFVVLIVLVLVFYFIKKFSKKSGHGADDLISVLAVHYISPKEKILLLDVLNEKILIGVTPQRISKLARIDNDMDFTHTQEKKNMKFADFLSRKLLKNKGLKKDEGKGER